MVDAEKKARFCGNCGSHNPYEYPARMFCSTCFAQNKDPIVDTLWCCGDWSPVVQACHCVRDALEKNNGAKSRR